MKYWRSVVAVVYVRGVDVLVYVSGDARGAGGRQRGNLSTRLGGCLEGDTRRGWEGGLGATSQKTRAGNEY